jgi:hypothetical protein
LQPREGHPPLNSHKNNNMLNTIFSPSPRRIAETQYQDAQRSLLQAHASVEDAKAALASREAAVVVLAERVARLKATLAAWRKMPTPPAPERAKAEPVLTTPAPPPAPAKAVRKKAA